MGPLRANVFAVVIAFLRCGDLASGFLRLRCPDCGEEHLLARDPSDFLIFGFFLTVSAWFKINPRMLKCVYCVRRLPSLSVEEFYDYWLNKHGPLVRKHAPAVGMRRYVQSHTIQNPMLNAAAQQPRGITEMYDGITEVWWDSPDALIAGLQTPEGQEANRILSEDEARFVDCANSAIFFTVEHTIFEF